MSPDEPSESVATEARERLPSRVGRVVAIALWTAGAFVGWMGINYALIRVLAWGWSTRRLPLPPQHMAEPLSTALVGTVLVGAMVCPLAALLLGMRGRLPGTRRAGRRTPRGFAVGVRGAERAR